MTETVALNKEAFEKFSEKIGYVSSIEDWAVKHSLNVFVAVSEHREIKDSIVSEIKKHSSCQILDIGCGYGFLMDRVSETRPNANVIGTDLSRFQIVNAKLRGVKGNFVVCCAEHMPFKNNFFDFISCSEVIEHVASKKDSLSEMERMLQKGSYLCISTDNPLSLYRKILDYARKKIGQAEETHEEYISQTSLSMIIPKNIRIYKIMLICPYSLLPALGPFGLEAVGKTWVRLTRLSQKLPFVGKQLSNKYVVFGQKHGELVH